MNKKILTHKKIANAGFSLTEVMIAVLIFMFSLIALAKFLGNLFAMDSYTNQRTEALEIARRKLVDLQSYAVINTTSGYTAYNDIATGNDTVTGTAATFTRNWIVTPNTVIGYKTVLMQVSWTTQDGSNKTLQLTSIIGKIDPGIAAQAASTGTSGTITP
jgi:Tfp pilus assembly protein PilV